MRREEAESAARWMRSVLPDTRIYLHCDETRDDWIAVAHVPNPLGEEETIACLEQVDGDYWLTRIGFSPWEMHERNSWVTSSYTGVTYSLSHEFFVGESAS